MFTFPDVVHLFPHKFTRLRAGRFAFTFVLTGSFYGFFLRHVSPPSADTVPKLSRYVCWMHSHKVGMAGPHQTVWLQTQLSKRGAESNHWKTQHGSFRISKRGLMTEPNNKRNRRRWVARVKTDSTHPPAGLFTRSASIIARTLASRKVSPKGPGSGMRMLTYFINRAGRGLSPERRAELEKAETLLAKRVQREQQNRTRKSS
jgi:tRNA(adenine34) deaminase